jgi:hypothetical protein
VPFARHPDAPGGMGLPRGRAVAVREPCCSPRLEPMAPRTAGGAGGPYGRTSPVPMLLPYCRRGRPKSARGARQPGRGSRTGAAGVAGRTAHAQVRTAPPPDRRSKAVPGRPYWSRTASCRAFAARRAMVTPLALTLTAGMSIADGVPAPKARVSWGRYGPVEPAPTGGGTYVNQPRSLQRSWTTGTLGSSGCGISVEASEKGDMHRGPDPVAAGSGRPPPMGFFVAASAGSGGQRWHGPVHRSGFSGCARRVLAKQWEQLWGRYSAGRVVAATWAVVAGVVPGLSRRLSCL